MDDIQHYINYNLMFALYYSVVYESTIYLLLIPDMPLPLDFYRLNIIKTLVRRQRDRESNGI